MNIWKVGSLIQLANWSGTLAVPIGGFRDLNNTLIDPTTVMLRIKDPAGNVSSFTYGGGQIVRDATGLYHFNMDTLNWNALPMVKGVWTYEWLSTGTGEAINDNQFGITPAAV